MIAPLLENQLEPSHALVAGGGILNGHVLPLAIRRCKALRRCSPESMESRARKLGRPETKGFAKCPLPQQSRHSPPQHTPRHTPGPRRRRRLLACLLLLFSWPFKAGRGTKSHCAAGMFTTNSKWQSSGSRPGALFSDKADPW